VAYLNKISPIRDWRSTPTYCTTDQWHILKMKNKVHPLLQFKHHTSVLCVTKVSIHSQQYSDVAERKTVPCNTCLSSVWDYDEVWSQRSHCRTQRQDSTVHLTMNGQTASYYCVVQVTVVKKHWLCNKINLPTKFEISICTHYENMKGDTKCRKWGGLG